MSSVARVSQSGGSVSDCLAGLGDLLPMFTPAPPASDRAFWTGLEAGLKSRLIAAGEAAIGADWPVLTAYAYRAYTEIGDRAGYEALYFARRRQLNDLALAEAVERQGRFLDALIDGIYLICEESGWQLPAHNAHVRGGARDPLPDPDRPVIDLFAAETGAQLAVLACLLSADLYRVSPAIVQRIDREIEIRITRPYRDEHFWWMGNGDEPMNNWTAWCTQNVLLSTFTRPNSQAVRHAVIEKSARSLDAFLKDYDDDGACEEGAFYYRHAALCLFGALDIMDTVAPTVFSALWREPKIRNMAEFVLHSHVPGAHYLNFADSSAVLAPCGAREFLFGKAVGSDALTALAAADASHNASPELPEEINLYYRLLALTMAEEMACSDQRPVAIPDIYYPSCGLFIARDECFVVGAKAGNNGEGHGHNDVGSVIVYKDGKPLLIDVGVETYTAQTFSDRRYELWTMRSGFHNLPGFGSFEQQAGERFGARDVRVNLDASTPTISMDIAGAYSEEAHVSSYRRTVRLLKGSGVEIVDEYEGGRQAELSLMFTENPEVTPERIGLGRLGEIALSGASQPRVEEIAVTDPRLRQAWPDRIYRVLVPLVGRELRLRIT